MQKRIYLGVKPGRIMETFRSDVTPTEETHGSLYIYAIGPFRTIQGARFMATYGAGNPHCQSVSQAEKLAKLFQSEGISV